MKTSFFIRKKTEAESYVGIIINHNYKAHRFSTPFVIQNKDWEKGYPKRTNVTKNLRENLEIIRLKLDAFCEKKIASGKVPTPSEIGTQVKVILGKEELPEFKSNLKQFLAWMENKNEPNTMLIVNRAFDNFSAYSPSVTFDDITPRFAEGYKQHLYDKGLLASSVNLYVCYIKSFLKWAYDNEMLSKPLAVCFKIDKIELKTIYALTKEELLKVETVELDGIEKEVRDLFLFSCYTGLRWIDICKFNSSEVVSGFILSKNQKTGTNVTIPVGKKTASLLKQYGGGLPKVERMPAYRMLKKVFYKAGLDRLVMDAHTGEMVHLHVVASFHTGRKTFATLALTAGANPVAVRAVGGWKGDRSFNRYVNLSNATLAKEIGKMSN